MPDAIIVQGLAKQFRRYQADRPRTLKEAFIRGFQGVKPIERFWALRDVSFSVSSGRMLGVIGANGAGKSTLLRLIGGVGRPDKGSVQVHGCIGALLGLGVLKVALHRAKGTPLPQEWAGLDEEFQVR